MQPPWRSVLGNLVTYGYVSPFGAREYPAFETLLERIAAHAHVGLVFGPDGLPSAAMNAGTLYDIFCAQPTPKGLRLERARRGVLLLDESFASVRPVSAWAILQRDTELPFVALQRGYLVAPIHLPAFTRD